jgi:hypothetical protein
MTAATGMDFGSNYAATVGGNVTASGMGTVLSFVQRHTSRGYVKKGHDDSTTAITVLQKYRDVVQHTDVQELAEDLAWWAFFFS